MVRVSKPKLPAMIVPSAVLISLNNKLVAITSLLLIGSILETSSRTTGS